MIKRDIWKFLKKNVSTRVVEYLYQKIMYSMELFLYNLCSPVVAHYFVARSTFKSVCFHCGDEDIFPISDELKKKTFSQFIQFVIHAKEIVLMNAPEVLDLLNGNLKLMHCAKH